MYRWLEVPVTAGWYLVHTQPGQFCIFRLIHFDGENCTNEIGIPFGPPWHFEGARWLGPVEKP